MFPDPVLEREIARETREWSAHALEKINPYYNDLPACPYAKKAWADERVGFSFKYGSDSQDLCSLVSRWDDSKDVIILIDFKPLPVDELDQYLDAANDAISQGIFGFKDMFLMGFHPDDSDNELLDDEGFASTIDTSYAMIFLQRLTKLQEASDALRVKGYYDNCEKYYDFSQGYAKRKSLYRRLKDAEKG